MKHLITLNELLKSTYLSAADKLYVDHEGRSKNLIAHASKSGTDLKQDRIYPHKFIFDGGLENEYFFITEYSYSEETLRQMNYLDFEVDLKSNWGNLKKFTMSFRIMGTNLGFQGQTKFTNKNAKIARSNANHMLRFFKECWEDEISVEYPDYEISGLSANALYKSGK